MKLHHWLFLLAAVAPPAVASPAVEVVQVVDDSGRSVVLPRPAQRIVALAPHVTELLFAIGAGGSVVGVVEYSDFPPQARELPSVGTGSAPDLERVLALQPDLIVAWASGNSDRAIARLDSLGLPQFLSEPRQLEQVATNLERLGMLTGNIEKANTEAKKFRQSLQQLETAYRGTRRVDVFYQVWDQPLLTVGGDHLITQVINLCSGRNIFADLTDLAPQIDLEAVVARNPEVILQGGSQRGVEWRTTWQRWQQLRAVKNGALFDIPADLIQRQSPRIAAGAEAVCDALAAARSRDAN